MPRGNIKNFGKKKAHPFGSPERSAAEQAKLQKLSGTAKIKRTKGK